MLKDKTIILGVTGCIAAYKSAELVRELKKLGADVWVAMTVEASKLVTPLTFRTLSGNPVITDLFSEELSNIPVPHITLTKKADLILVAPATANVVAKVAGGIADDPLTTIILSAKCPVIFAPAMNTAMWENEATQDNVSSLKLRGYKFIGPDRGPLACGDEGIGRLSPVEEIVERLKQELLPNQDLLGLKVLVTAGPTRENIDPVRFISNRSSGKMGYALAKAAAKRGAAVTLISGPTDLNPPAGVETIKIETTSEMFDAVMGRFDSANLLIMAAAVSDFKPKAISAKKIKKSNGEFSLGLEKNEDVLKEAGKTKKDQILIGFALETDDLVANAARKLKEKDLDMVIANDASAFESDASKVTFIFKDGTIEELPKMEKEKIAERILNSASGLDPAKGNLVKLSKANG